MKIIIEKDLPVLKAKKALEILIGENELLSDYLGGAVTKNNIVIIIANLSVPNRK